MANNIILGSIPGSGGGLRKTYEESILFYNVSYFLIEKVLDSCSKRQKLYLSNKGVLFSEEYKHNHDNYREVEIIGFYPYLLGNSTQFAVEVIDKQILHEHLLEENEMRRGRSR